MSDIKNRIRQIIEREELTAAAFAESIGVAQATISHILGPRNKYPSMDFILRLHQRYPDIDMNWLLTGVGSIGSGPGSTGLSKSVSVNSSASDKDASDPAWASIGPDEGYPLFAENANFRANGQADDRNRKEIASDSPQNGPKEIVRQQIVYRERPARKIIEIRIFFDDNTFETFRPEK